MLNTFQYPSLPIPYLALSEVVRHHITIVKNEDIHNTTNTLTIIIDHVIYKAGIISV